MTATRTSLRVFLTAVLLTAPAAAGAQATAAPDRRVQVAAGGGYLTSGRYFTGPGSTAFANGDSFVGAVQVGVAAGRSLAVVLSGAHARPEWRLSGVPLFGGITLPGARLWFFDAALRGRLPLGPAPRPPELFAQAGAGLAHYAVDATVVGRRIEEDATNFAVALGAGVQIPLGGRLGVEVLAKDYIASFESVDDLAAFGVEGRRAHTLLLLASARLDL
jgi:hypothetical protein